MSVDRTIESVSASDEVPGAATPGDSENLGTATKWFGVLATAIACFLAGYLSLSLSPREHALPAVWPGAGIALAAVLLLGPRALLGVALGSFAVFVDFGITGDAALPIAGLLTVSSCLQAMLAARLIRPAIDRPDPLGGPRDVGRFLFVGVLCGIVNASVVTASFVHVDLVPYGSVFLSAYAWWIAESLGFIVMTPLVLAWFAKPAFAWRPRRLLVAAPLIAASIIVLLAFFSAIGRERERQERVFSQIANAMVEDLQVRLSQYENVLLGIERLFAASERVTDEEFKKFVELPLKNYEGLIALAWVERTVDETGADAYPVRYAEPYTDHESAIGVEVAPDPVRRTMLTTARDLGRPVATPPVSLGTSGLTGFLVAAPIYNDPVDPIDEEMRRRALTGFAVGVVVVRELVRQSLSGFDRGNVGIRITDAKIAEVSLYESGSDKFGDEAETAPSWNRVEIGEREWAVQIVTPRGRAWFAWWVLGAGLWLVAILGAILFLITGRSTAIELLVRERTAQLSEVNEQLGEEIDQHMRTEKRLRTHAYQLERSNEELDTLTYIATNDLKPDLVAIDELAGNLGEGTEGHGDLPPAIQEHLAQIHARVARASTLLDDLLDYSNVNRVLHDTEPIAIEEMLQQSVAALDVPDGFRICAHGLPILEGERVPLDHVFRNLVDNSIRHHDRARGRIDISCRYADDRVEFIVADDGPGIPSEQREKIFEMYRSNEGDGAHASRLGLALVKKIVEQRGGTITIECGLVEGDAADADTAADAGDGTDAHGGTNGGVRGTTVRFTWPLGATWDQ